MNRKENRALPLFLLALALYAGVVYLSLVNYQRESGKAADWAKLDRAQARLLLRSYMYLKYIDSGAAPARTKWLKDLLSAANENWEKALQARPADLQTRMALAACQREAEDPALGLTLITAPQARNQEKNLKFLMLQTLIMAPRPDPKILTQKTAIEFINQNPARRLWMASVYARIGEQKKAEREWLLGYRESAPYAIASLIILASWWGAVPLIGLVCALSLVRRKSSQNKGGRSGPAGVPPSVQEPEGANSGVSLALASEGFMIWLAAYFLGGTVIAGIAAYLDLSGSGALAVMLVSFLAAIIAVSWLKMRSGGRLSVGWRISPFGFHARVALAVFLLSPIGMGLARLLQYHFQREMREPSVLLMAGGGSILLRALLLVAACVIVPIAEETVFRGLIYRGLRSQWGPFAGIVISSAIFAVGHMDLITALPLFVFSLGLAWSVERTGSLLPAAIAHGLFNLFPLLLLNVMTL